MPRPPMPPPGPEKKPQEKPKTFGGWVKFISKNFKSTMKRLLYIYKLVWEAKPGILAALSATSILGGVLPVLGSVITKLVIDALSDAYAGTLDRGFTFIIGILIFQMIYWVTQQVVNTLNDLILRVSNDLLVYSIRIKMMNKAKTLDLASFDMPEFYSKMENANQEVSARPMQVMWSSFAIVSSIISFISYIAILGSVLPWAPIVIILMSVPSTLVHFIYRKKLFSYTRHHSKKRRQMTYYSGLLTDKDLVKEVKLFDLADTFKERYDKTFKGYYKGVKKIILSEGLWGFLSSFAELAVHCGMLVLIAWKVFMRMLTVGDFSLYSGALLAISNGVESIISTSAGIYEGTLFIDNLIVFMQEEAHIVPSIDPPREVNKGAGHEIIFENVSFAYPKTDKYVLKNLNFTISGGETIALVGLNGAGKTTLIKLLTRLYDPSEGRILLDGHDIREYDVRELYDIYGIIFQDFGKFAFTVAENIGFGQISRIGDRQAIEEAAKQSDATRFIGKLKNGFDTNLMRIFEENSTELSGGQWQKISVARAFFRDSDILILDEPTAALDAIAEQEIFNQFDKLRGNKTTIFVSHRLSSATLADKIIVLNYGEIVEMGKHRDLMKLNGKYAELFNAQARKYLEK